MSTQKTSFEPLAPVQLVKPNGRVIPYGYGAATDAARGTALLAARTASVAGDTIVVYKRCSVSSTPSKTGVRIQRANDSAVITNTGNIPAIDADDLAIENTICCRRNASLYAREPQFLFYENKFNTSNDINDALLVTQTGSLTIGQNRATYTAPNLTDPTSAYLLAPIRLKNAQAVSIVDLLEHNASGTFNDIGVGFVITLTPTSDTIIGHIIALVRKTAAAPDGYIELQYTYSGSIYYSAGPTLTEPFPYPSKPMCILNHNDFAFGIELPSGEQKILHNFKVALSTHKWNNSDNTTSHWDLEDAATVACLRPCLFYQSDNVQATTIRGWEVRALGTLGDREHYLVTYENGEAIRDSNDNVYLTADATHVTMQTVDIGQNYLMPNSQYMRNQSACRLYDPRTGWLGAMTAKYAQTSNDRVFGCQQGAIMFDRSTGLWWQYFAKWNDAGAGIGPIRTYYRSSYTSPLYGYHLYTDLQLLHLNNLGSPFSNNDYYDFKPQYYSGRWYGAVTVTGTGGPGNRAASCVSGTSPSSFDTIEFVDTEQGEGTYFWNIGGVPHIVTGLIDGQTVRILSLSGTFERELAVADLPGRYPLQAAFLDYVRNGKTQYQIITFDDHSAGGHGGDYKSDFNAQYQTLAFGGTLVKDAGTFSGEEHTIQPGVSQL